MDREKSQTPNFPVTASTNEMEGVITYSSSQQQQGSATGPAARSATITENTTIQHFPPLPTALLSQNHVMAQTSTPNSTPHFFDPNAGLDTISQNSQLANRNITINHMSGNVVDIQPPKVNINTTNNNTNKSMTSREGSGTREDPPKPPLFNIPWSDDEQRLLEKLLDEYPDEPVAAQRFQKISAAMGTRTPKQVASRVQKYFIKLVKAGLEAPGRMNYSLEPTKPKSKATTPSGAGASSTTSTSPSKGKKRKDPGSEKPKASRPKKKEDGSSRSGSSAPSTKKQKAKSVLGSGFGRTSGTQYLNYSAAPTVYMSEEDDEENVQDMIGVSSNSYGTPAPNDGTVSHLGFAVSVWNS